MSKEVVRYHNDFNDIPLKGMTEKELNILLSLLYSFREERTLKIELTELRHISRGDINYPRFIRQLKNTYKKFMQITLEYSTDVGFGGYSFFTDYDVNEDTRELTISVHEKALYVIQNLQEQFTVFDLQDFSKLKSVYSKQVFKKLKQFRNTGMYIVSLDDFRTLLDIPVNYKMSDLDKWVFKSILEELKPLFPSLKLEKVKKDKDKKTSKIIGLKFTWNKSKIINTEIDNTSDEIQYITQLEYDNKKEDYRLAAGGLWNSAIEKSFKYSMSRFKIIED